MTNLRVLVAGLGLSLGVSAGLVWAQTPAAVPAANPAQTAAPAAAPKAGAASAAAPGGHLGGVGAAVPPEKPAADFSAKQNDARLAAWRAQIRKILYVPDKLPALEPKTWSTFSPTPGRSEERRVGKE